MKCVSYHLRAIALCYLPILIHCWCVVVHCWCVVICCWGVSHSLPQIHPMRLTYRIEQRIYVRESTTFVLDTYSYVCSLK